MNQDQSPPATAERGFFGWIRRMKAWVESLADRRHAATALFLLAAAESIFFPIPADVLLIALCVGRPRRGLWYAVVCTLGSVVGGVIGYSIGYLLWYAPGGDFSGVARFFFDHVPGFSEALFFEVGQRFEQYAVETIFTASFTPIPYKLVTITAGVFKLNVALFFAVSLAGRAGRFFLVALLFFFFGEPVKAFIDKYLEWLSILFVLLLIGGFLAVKLLF